MTYFCTKKTVNCYKKGLRYLTHLMFFLRQMMLNGQKNKALLNKKSLKFNVDTLFRVCPLCPNRRCGQAFRQTNFGMYLKLNSL